MTDFPQLFSLIRANSILIQIHLLYVNFKRHCIRLFYNAFRFNLVTQLGFESLLYSTDIQYIKKYLFYRSR